MTVFLSESAGQAILERFKDTLEPFDREVSRVVSHEFRAVIAGEPSVKRRPRVFWDERIHRMRAVTPQATHDAETAISWAMKAAWHREADAQSLFGLRCVFTFSRTKAGKDRRVDGDNCVKCVLDACNNVIVADDSQFRDVHYFVRFGAEPSTEIVWWVLP